MDYLKIIKALSNETRFNMLSWLKDPKLNFEEFGWEPYKCDDKYSDYVCVGCIKEKTGQSQSTTSEHLSILEKSGLLKSLKIGQWTFYARNEEVINEFIDYINKEL